MDQNTEFHIIVADRSGQTFFWDLYRYQDFAEILPLAKENCEVLGFVIEDDIRGCHVCEHSALDEDMTGYIDEIQEGDNSLSDSEKYIVCWYEYVGSEELLYRVDFGLSKNEILDNVKAGKYVEGAFYIPEDKLLSLEDIEHALFTKEHSMLDGDEKKGAMKRYIWGFPGVGKSSLKLPDTAVLDTDSRLFSFLDVPVESLHQDSDRISYARNPEYPQNYLRYIQEAKADIVLLNCHLSLLDNLDKENILIVYPHLDLLPEYLNRYADRGDNSFVSYMAEEGEGMIRCIEASGYDSYRIDSSNTYLSDLFERNDFKMKVMTKQELTRQLKRAMDLGVIRDELHTDSSSKLIFDASFAQSEAPRGLKNPEVWANAVLDGQYEMDIDSLLHACAKREAELAKEQALLDARGGLSREELADKIMQGIVNGALGICYDEIAPYSHGYEVTFGGAGALGSTRNFTNRWECYNCRFFDVPAKIVDKIERGMQDSRVFGASAKPLDVQAMLASIEEAEKNKIQGFIPEKDTNFERSQYPYRRGSVASVMDVHVGKGLDGIVQHHYTGDYSSMTPIRQNILVETLVCMKGFCLDCLDRLEIGPDGRRAVVEYLKKHGTDISTPEKLQEWIRKHPELCGKDVNREVPSVQLPSNVSVSYKESWEPSVHYSNSLQWWSNADGDLYNSVDLGKAPEELQSAVSRLDPFSRNQIIHLAETEQGYGLAFSFNYDEALGKGNLSMGQIFESLLQDAAVIAQNDLFRNAELFALEAPPGDNAHTLIVFVPAGISREEFDRAAETLDTLTYQSVHEMASAKKPALDSRINAARSGLNGPSELNSPGKEPER